MSAEQAAAEVTAWLRNSPDGDRTVGPSAVRVMRENITKTDGGWHVPFNAVGYLDGTDVGKGIFPIPVVFVPEDGGDITYAMDVMARGGRPPKANRQETDGRWVEVADPEFDRAAFPNIEVPQQAILRWDEVDEQGHPTGQMRFNDQHTVGPVWRGWPIPKTTVQKLRNYYLCNWIDRNTLLRNMLPCEVLVVLDEERQAITWSGAEEAVRNYQVFSSTDQITAGHKQWQRRTLGSLLRQWLAEEPRTSFVLDPGRPLQEQFHFHEFAALQIAQDDINRPEIEVSAETNPRIRALVAELSETYGLRRDLLPRFLHSAAQQARKNGYELTVDECERYARGVAWNYRYYLGRQNKQPVQWPHRLEAEGMIAYRDENGAPQPTPWTFGKFSPRWTPNDQLAWHRVVGAYIGFAVGESLTSGPETGQLGGYTQQLLKLTDQVIRGLPPQPPKEGLPSNFPPPQRIDGWLTALEASETPAAAPLTIALATSTSGVSLADPSSNYPQNVARALLGQASEETVECVDFLVQLFRRLLGGGEFSYPMHVHLQDLYQSCPPRLQETVQTVLALRDDRGTDDTQQIATIGDGTSPLSLLGRALFAAAKSHFDPQHALQLAAGQSGDPALVAALTGAFVGARAGIPGLPGAWVTNLPHLGLVENIAGDAFWHFNQFGVLREPAALSWWHSRYPPHYR